MFVSFSLFSFLVLVSAFYVLVYLVLVRVLVLFLLNCSSLRCFLNHHSFQHFIIDWFLPLGDAVSAEMAASDERKCKLFHSITHRRTLVACAFVAPRGGRDCGTPSVGRSPNTHHLVSGTISLLFLRAMIIYYDSKDF